ncbi:hypothetical protein F5Y06DRAFT_282775 [Hypoxylon sp. FL0890]|nr:hypothetical protein F5Y06DRAFT_282775 [Hypoxylon sp. FL0890]
MASSQQHLTNVTTAEHEGLRDKGDHGRCFTFFDLPTEVRLMIYRLLLCQNHPIWGPVLCYRSRENRLSTSILCTCRRILHEARPILYGENIWGYMIRHRYGEGYINIFEAEYFMELFVERIGVRLEDLKRLHIEVEICREDEVFCVRSALTMLLKTLSELPNIQYVHIRLRLDQDSQGDTPGLCTVLQKLTLLQRVHHVDFDGVPPVYAKYLTDKMTGSAPLDHLPKMYDALALYAKHFDDCAELLQEACDAIEENNVDRFKDARTKIIEWVTQHMTYAFDHLFDHDAR